MVIKNYIYQSRDYYCSGMTMLEFILAMNYGLQEGIGEKRTNNCHEDKMHIDYDLLEKLVYKIRVLYQPNYRIYAVSSHKTIRQNKKYVTKKETITDAVIKEHLLCNATVALFPAYSDYAKWFLFDVDISIKTKDGLKRCKFVTKKLINKLRNYIPEQYIYCYRSGCKGYHVVIYLDKGYSRREIQQFQNSIKQMMMKKSIINDLKEIESRPYSADFSGFGQTAKLPLGRNLANVNNESNFCCFVSIDNLEPIVNQYNYFLNIQQLPKEKFEMILEKVRMKKEEVLAEIQNYGSLERDSAVDIPSIDYNGNMLVQMEKHCKKRMINKYGERNRITFLLILELKTFFRANEEQIENQICKWLQYHKCKYSTPLEKAVEETRKMIKDVFKRNLTYNGKLTKTVEFTKKDMDFCLDIVNKNGKIGVPEINIYNILLSFMRLAKTFKRTIIYFSYEDIMAKTNIKNRNLISKYLKILEDKNKIKIVSKVDYRKGEIRANTYSINAVNLDSTEDRTYELKFNDEIKVIEIMKNFYEENELKKRLTKSLKKLIWK